MCEEVDVLTLIDDVNKIYYIESRTFALGSEQAKKAKNDYVSLLNSAQMNGYQIIKREKNITPIDGGIMTAIDEKINGLGGRPR